MSLPKPAAVKALNGDPGRRGIPDEPKPAPGYPACPKGLKDTVRQAWEALRSAIEPMGYITQADAWPLLTLCKAIARQLEAEEQLEKTGGPVIINRNGNVRNPWERVRESAVMEAERLFSRLCISPADRAKLGLTLMQAAKESRALGNSPLGEFIDV